MLNLNRFYIDGRWVEARSTRTHPLVDPNTEEPFGHVSLADEADVNDAVAAAKRVFPAWSTSEPAARIALVERIRAAYLDRSEEMAHAISREMGAPIDLARAAQTGAGPRHMT